MFMFNACSILIICDSFQGSYNPSGSGQDPDSDFDPTAEESVGTVRKRGRPGRRSSQPGKRRGRPKKGTKVRWIFNFFFDCMHNFDFRLDRVETRTRQKTSSK